MFLLMVHLATLSLYVSLCLLSLLFTILYFFVYHFNLNVSLFSTRHIYGHTQYIK